MSDTLPVFDKSHFELMKTHIFFVAFVAMMHTVSYGQDYFEFFSDQENMGIAGPCDSVPESCTSFLIPDGITWSISGNTIGLTASTDWVKIVNGELSARDSDGEICWKSPWIQLESTGVYKFSVVIKEVGDLESSDYADVSVLVDTDTIEINAWLGGDTSHTLAGDFPDDNDWGVATVVQDSIVGDSVQIIICMNTDAGTEYIRVDSVQLVNQVYCPLSGYTVISEQCDSAATYSVALTYSGADSSAYLVNLAMNGFVMNGSQPGDLLGAPVEIVDIPVDSIWEVVVLSEICRDTIRGKIPVCAYAPPVFISEIDVDQQGADTSEFIELAGPSGTALDSFVVVCFNGSNGSAYQAWDLTGLEIGANGFITLCIGPNSASYCNTGVPGSLQNGPDGIGLYYGRSVDEFENGAPVSSNGLLDGLRYGTSDPPAENLTILDKDPDCEGNDCQVDENLHNLAEIESIQRGSWFVGPPTAGAPNNDPLAVHLLDFQVVGREGQIFITWSTLSEHHNDFFEVTIRKHGQKFADVVTVPGKHSSRVMIDYKIKHRVSTGGRYLVSLESVDENGIRNRHGVRSLWIDEAQKDIRVSVQNNNIHVNWPSADMWNYHIVDVAGRTLKSDCGISTDTYSISMEGLPIGICFIVLQSRYYTETIKIVNPVGSGDD